MTQDTALYKQYQARTRALLDAVDMGAQVFESLDMKGWLDTAGKLSSRVSSDRFRVLVIGEFKRGKSTFINAMLGQEVLPAFSVPCTAVINEIKWAEEPRAVLYFRNPVPKPIPTDIPETVIEHLKAANDGAPEPIQIDVDELEDFVVIPDPAKEQEDSVAESPYDRVELFWNLDLCRNGVEIIDSPGLNEHKTRTKVTTNYLNSVDAVVFVMSCQALASMSELKVIDGAIRGGGHEDIFFVCNRFDQIRPRERDRLVKYAHKKLSDRTSRGAEGVYFTSAIDALEGRENGNLEAVENSGILRFEQELADFLANDRGRIKLLQPAREFLNGIQEARNKVIPGQRSMHETSRQNLQERYDKAKPRLADAERRRDQIIQRVRRDLARVRDDVERMTESRITDLARHVPAWAEKYEAETNIGLTDLFRMKSKIEELAKEVSKAVAARIEDEQRQWQSNELTPFIIRRMESVTDDAEAQLNEIVARLDAISAEISGVSEHAAANTDTGRDISTTERVLSAAGGFVIGGAGSALVGGAMGYKEMLKSLGPQIAIVVVGIGLLGLNPLLVIPALIAGGILQGYLKKSKSMKEARRKIGEALADEMLKKRAEMARTAGEAFDRQTTDYLAGINAGLTKEIQACHDQVEAVLRDMERDQPQIEAKLTRLSEAEKSAGQIEARIMDLVMDLAQSTA